MLRIGQVEPSATADGKYTDGSVAGGIAATRLRAAAFNAMQEELANIVESAGMSLSPDDMTQVLTALKKQLLSRANPFADIKADGPAAVAAALSNLQLGEAAKRGVGTGANQLPDMSFFSRSIESNGYFMLPSGVIVQWGRVTISGTTTAHITYPIPFPTNRLVLTASPVGSGFTVNPATPVFTNGDRFGCDTSSWGTSNYVVMWIAIGG